MQWVKLLAILSYLDRKKVVARSIDDKNNEEKVLNFKNYSAIKFDRRT